MKKQIKIYGYSLLMLSMSTSLALAQVDSTPHSRNISIHNELLRLKDFHDMRKHVLKTGTISLDNIIIDMPPEDPNLKKQKFHKHKLIAEKAPKKFKKNLKDRRMEAYNLWKSMTKLDKEKFFSTLPKVAEEKLKTRRKYLKGRLGLTPIRGKKSIQ